MTVGHLLAQDEVVRHSRQVWLRFSPSHRWVNSLVHAHVQLQT